MKKTQCDKMLITMLGNKWKKTWYAKDFLQNDGWFIGYEATARMSDLIRKYEDLFIIGKDGRFRTLEINWENQKAVNNAIDYISLLEK